MAEPLSHEWPNADYVKDTIFSRERTIIAIDRHDTESPHHSIRNYRIVPDFISYSYEYYVVEPYIYLVVDTRFQVVKNSKVPEELLILEKAKGFEYEYVQRLPWGYIRRVLDKYGLSAFVWDIDGEPVAALIVRAPSTEREAAEMFIDIVESTIPEIFAMALKP